MSALFGPALRMLLSLGVVLVLMYVAARLLRRTHGGVSVRMPRVRSTDGGGRLRALLSAITAKLSGGVAVDSSGHAGSAHATRRPGRRRNRLEVLARQPLGKSASVAVLRVAGRTLLIGVTEHSVQLLSEVDATAFDNIQTTVLAPHDTDPLMGVAPNDSWTQPLPDVEQAAMVRELPLMSLLREHTVRRG